MKLLFFDTETTSVRPGHICQLSYITVDTSTKPQKTVGKNFFFTVDEMDPAAQEVHGFSLEKLYELSNGLEFLEQIQDFMKDFFDADFVIGHNVQFDVKFLKHEVNSLAFFSISSSVIPKNLIVSESLGFFIPLPFGEGIEKKANELFQGSGNYHDARFDTAAVYLLVIEGMKKKLIKPGFFSSQL